MTDLSPGGIGSVDGRFKNPQNTLQWFHISESESGTECSSVTLRFSSVKTWVHNSNWGLRDIFKIMSSMNLLLLLSLAYGMSLLGKEYNATKGICFSSICCRVGTLSSPFLSKKVEVAMSRSSSLKKILWNRMTLYFRIPQNVCLG